MRRLAFSWSEPQRKRSHVLANGLIGNRPRPLVRRLGLTSATEPFDRIIQSSAHLSAEHTKGLMSGSILTARSFAARPASTSGVASLGMSSFAQKSMRVGTFVVGC